MERRKMEGGAEHYALIDDGTPWGRWIPESLYRAAHYRPDFAALPWRPEPAAAETV